MEKKGYKGFFTNSKNQNGDVFEEGKVYTAEEGEVFFGKAGHGFHFCENLEDCFTYFNPRYSVYAEVTGMGNIKIKDDETTDSYGICVAESLRVDRFLTREDIIEYYLDPTFRRPHNSVVKFLRCFKLTEEELERFEEFYLNSSIILETIMYYQRDIKDTYLNKTKTFNAITELREKLRSKEK